MVTVGMLSHRNDPRKVYKSYAFAATAKMEGVDFYFFSPGRVDFNDQSILGWIYENGQWIEKKLKFPDVIYNSSSPQTAKQKEIVTKLKKLVPFTSHSIGNKLNVYRKIQAAKTFEQYIIPFIEILEVGDVKKFINNYQKIVLKPINGSSGENIIFVCKKGQKFIVCQDSTLIMNETELTNLITQLIKSESYLAQAYIPSNTKNGWAYTLRLHVQKDGKGLWQLTTIYPCFARQGIVANLNKMGYTMMIEDFFKQEFDEHYFNIKRYLERFAIHFSNQFGNLYDNPLDELGIDVGLDRNHKIWIFEVNWRPGTPPTYSLELEVVKQMISYARFLAETSVQQQTQD